MFKKFYGIMILAITRFIAFLFHAIKQPFYLMAFIFLIGECVMTISQRKLAKSMGINEKTIRDVKKTLGIESKSLSQDELYLVIEQVTKTVDLKSDTRKKLEKASSEFTPNVRRIDKQDQSSVLDMLQDCKEQYVHNEGLIKRFQYEISLQDITMHGNSNGTLSPLPQISMMEKFQKINISLRNQIVQLEQELGRNAKPQEDDDPFK